MHFNAEIYHLFASYKLGIHHIVKNYVSTKTNYILGHGNLMNNLEAQIPVNHSLDLDLMRDFIMQNPDFVRADEELLNVIATESHTGNVVSLDQLARNRMLKETRVAKSRFSQIVETARANYESQIRVQEAIIAILDANDAEDLRQRLSGHVAFSLAADACVLAVSETSADSQTMDKIGTIVERLVPVERPVHIGAADSARVWLYGPEAQYIRSEAFARIEFGKNRRIGFLAIASSDIDCFREDMGHELINFFARVVERVLSRLEADGQI